MIYNMPGLCKETYNLTRPVPRTREQMACMIRAAGDTRHPVLTNFDHTTDTSASGPSFKLNCDLWGDGEPSSLNKFVVVDPGTKALAVIAPDYTDWLIFQCEDAPIN